MPIDSRINAKLSQMTESKLDVIAKQSKANADGIAELNRLIRETNENTQERMTEFYRHQSANHDAVMAGITKIQTQSEAIAFDVQAAVTETFEISKALKSIKHLLIGIGAVIIALGLLILFAVSQSQMNVDASDVKDAISSAYNEYFGEYGMTLPEFPEMPPLSE